MIAYGTTSRDYLTRARALRANDNPESLLYAALEIRCGIEARLHEYLASPAKVATRRKGLWRIKDLSREVENVFDVHAKAVVTRFVHPETGEKMKIEYTPVSPKLRKIGEQLGEFLHFPAAHKVVSAEFTERLAAAVDSGIRGLTFATRGTLLGPPTGAGPNNEEIRLTFEEGRMPSFLKAGVDVKFTMRFILVGKDKEKVILKPD